MLRPIALEDLRNLELIPQAVIRKPVSFFEERLCVHFLEAHDDFDSYSGAAFSLNGTLPFALKHYRGHPPDTTSVYLSSEIGGVEKISRIVESILHELKLSSDSIEWQRSDDPHL